MSFQPKDDWKSECERVLGRSLVLSEHNALCDTPDEFYSPIDISAMDFYDGLLICCEYYLSVVIVLIISNFASRLKITFLCVVGSPVVIPLSDIPDETQMPARLEVIACLYKSTNNLWKQVGTIEPLPHNNPSVICCQLTHELVLAGRSNGSIIIWHMQLTPRKTYEVSIDQATK